MTTESSMQSADQLAQETSKEFSEFVKASLKFNLDYSVDSLKQVDDYLDLVWKAVHKTGFLGKLLGKKPSNEDTWRVIANSGFYTGEVIKKNFLPDYRWFTFQDWIARNPAHVEFLGMEEGMGTSFILGNDKGDMCLPLSKAGKFLQNGREDSVYFFARTMEISDDETDDK